MMCDQHPGVTLREVCGELGCGECYADSMIGQRVSPAALDYLTYSIDVFGHFHVIRVEPARATRTSGSRAEGQPIDSHEMMGSNPSLQESR